MTLKAQAASIELFIERIIDAKEMSANFIDQFDSMGSKDQGIIRGILGSSEDFNDYLKTLDKYSGKLKYMTKENFLDAVSSSNFFEDSEKNMLREIAAYNDLFGVKQKLVFLNKDEIAEKLKNLIYLDAEISKNKDLADERKGQIAEWIAQNAAIDGAVDSMGKLNKEATSFGAQMSLMLKSPAFWASAIIAVASLIIPLIAEIHKTSEEIIEIGTEAENKVNDLRSAFEAQQKLVSESGSSYAKLAQGVDQFTGKNRSLSTEDYEEYLKLSNEIAELMPGLVAGYDAEGNAILNLQGDYESINATLEEYIELQRQALAEGAKEELPAIADKAIEEVKVAKEKSYYKNILEQQYAEYLDAMNSPQGLQTKFYLDAKGVSAEAETLKAILKNLDIEVSSTFGQDENITGMKGRFEELTFSVEDFKEAVSDAYGVLARETAKLDDSILSKYSELNKTLITSLYGDDAASDIYKAFSDVQKSAMQKIMAGFDWHEMGLTEYEDIYGYIEKTLLPFMQSEENAGQIELAFNLVSEFNGNKISTGEFKSEIDKIITNLGSIEKLDPEIIAALKIVLDYDSIVNTSQAAGGIVSQIGANLSNLGGLELKKQIEAFLDSLSGKELDAFLDWFHSVEYASGTTWSTVLQDWEYAKSQMESDPIELEINFEKLDGIKEAMSALSEVRSSASDGNSNFYSALSAVGEQFANVSGIDEYINRLAAAKAASSDLAPILSELANAYMEQQVQAGELSGASLELITVMLEEAGVANAAEVAIKYFGEAQTKAALDAAYAEGGLTGIIDLLNTEAYASGTARQQLIMLAAQQIATSNTGLNFAQQILALQELAKQAGFTAAQLAFVFGLSSGKLGLSKSGNAGDVYAVDADGNIAGTAPESFGSILARFQQQLADSMKIEFTPPGGVGGGGGGGGGSSSDKVKEEADAIKAELDSALAEMEHSVFLEERGNNDPQKIVEAYQAAMDLLHSTAEQFREMDDFEGKEEYLAELQKQWWDYYDAQVETLQSAHDARISDIEFEIEAAERNGASYDELIEKYQEAKEETEAFADELRDMGFDETSDEIQDLTKEIWEYEDAIKDTRQQAVDDAIEMADAASEAVDQIQNVISTFESAVKEFNDTGGISVDTFQSLIDVGVQYLHLLTDENGMLNINIDTLNQLYAAKVQDMAITQAKAYLEQVIAAATAGDAAALAALTGQTYAAADATWALVDALLAELQALGAISSGQFENVSANIDNLKNLAGTAISGIGSVGAAAGGSISQAADESLDGVKDLFEHVMDMLEHEHEQQIEALEEQKEAYSELIELRKEALKAAEEENEYQDEVAEKIKEIAKLQERINTLALDDSRDAQAQRRALEEELAELQKELAETQHDYSVEAQEEALDRMEEAYEKEKDAEIEALEEAVSSYEKRYAQAIKYIEEHWETLYGELIDWNSEYGSVLNSEITSAWESSLEAAKEYGSYVAALEASMTDNATSSHGGGGGYGGGGHGGNPNNGNSDSSGSASGGQSRDKETIRSIVEEMRSNAGAWKDASDEERAYLSDQNLQLAEELGKLGVPAERDDPTGVWYYGSPENGITLFGLDWLDKYHSGGVVGGASTLKQRETLAILENDELILDRDKQRALFRAFDFVADLEEKLRMIINPVDFSSFIRRADKNLQNIVVSPAGSSQAPNIEFGDVYIYGANEDTVAKHREINRQFANDVLKQLNIKK